MATPAPDGNPNDLLQQLEEMGYSDGISTTIKGKSTTVAAGSYVGKGESLYAALADLLEQLAGLAKKDRPKPLEATTREVALDEVDGDRQVVHASEVV